MANLLAVGVAALLAIVITIAYAIVLRELQKINSRSAMCSTSIDSNCASAFTAIAERVGPDNSVGAVLCEHEVKMLLAS
jgi:hypothetical protein